MPQGRAVLIIVAGADGITRVVVVKDDFVGVLDGGGGLVGLVCGEGGRGVDDGGETLGGHGLVMVGHCAGRVGRRRRGILFGKVIRVFLMHLIRDAVDNDGSGSQ